MKLFIRDKVYFTDPTTGEIIEDTITDVNDNVVMGKKFNLTDLYWKGELNVYRLECHICGFSIPAPLSQFQVDGIKGKQQLLPSTCGVCLEESRYPDNPEEGIILWI
jgi:hypothetical protein